MKRILSDEEKRLCEKNLKRIDEEIIDCEYQTEIMDISLGNGMKAKLDYDKLQYKKYLDKVNKDLDDARNNNELSDDDRNVIVNFLSYEILSTEKMLAKGLDLKFNKEKSMMTAQLNKVVNDLKELVYRKQITQEQMQNGVDVKPKKGGFRK